MFESNLALVIRKLDGLYSKFSSFGKSSQSKKIMLLICLLIIFSIKLFISDYRPGYNDPAGDAAFVIDGALNIRDGKGYYFDSIWLFDESDGDINKEITKPGFLYPPLTSVILAVIFLFTESIFALILFQILVFLIFIFIYFLLISKLFNEKISFFSSILLIFNPVLVTEVVSVPKTHILGLFFIVSFFLYYTFFDKNRNYFYLGLLSGLAYLTRDLNLLLLISLLFFSFYNNRRFDQSLKLLGGFFFLTLLWFYRNFIHFGTFNPRSTTTGYELVIFPSNGSSHGLNLEAFLQYLSRFVYDISSPNLYYFLLPFLFFGIIKHMKDGDKQCLLFYSLLYLGFILFFPLIDHDTGYRMLYLMPVFILTLPFALSSFFEITRDLSLSLEFKNNVIFSIFISFFILISSSIIIKDEIGSKNHLSSTYDSVQDYKWAKDNIDSENNVCLANRLPHRYHYFTDSRAITLPSNLDNQTLPIFLMMYEIDYLFIEAEVGSYNTNEYIYSELFSGTDNFQIENIHISLVRYQEANFDSTPIYIYKVERFVEED